MPIYSDVIARLDDKAVKSVISELENQFKDGGANVGDAFSKAFSSATRDFGAGLSDGVRGVIGDMGSLGSAAESALGGLSPRPRPPPPESGSSRWPPPRSAAPSTTSARGSTR